MAAGGKRKKTKPALGVSAARDGPDLVVEILTSGEPFSFGYKQNQILESPLSKNGDYGAASDLPLRPSE